MIESARGRTDVLRREAGSRLYETPGVSLTDVRDYLGHRDVGQTLSTTTQRIEAALATRRRSRKPRTTT